MELVSATKVDINNKNENFKNMENIISDLKHSAENNASELHKQLLLANEETEKIRKEYFEFRKKIEYDFNTKNENIKQLEFLMSDMEHIHTEKINVLTRNYEKTLENNKIEMNKEMNMRDDKIDDMERLMKEIEDVHKDKIDILTSNYDTFSLNKSSKDNHIIELEKKLTDLEIYYENKNFANEKNLEIVKSSIDLKNNKINELEKMIFGLENIHKNKINKLSINQESI